MTTTNLSIAFRDIEMKDYIFYDNTYQVTPDGKVFGRAGKQLKPQIIHGYAKLRLQSNGKSKQVMVHRLVAELYLPKSHKPEVNHIDGNKLNNHVSNLEWATRSENAKHALDTGLNKNPSGFEARNAKITPITWQLAKDKLKEGWSQTKIAKLIGVSQKTIWRIAHG